MKAKIDLISNQYNKELYKLTVEENWEKREEISPFLPYLLMQVKDKVKSVTINYTNE